MALAVTYISGYLFLVFVAICLGAAGVHLLLVRTMRAAHSLRPGVLTVPAITPDSRPSGCAAWVRSVWALLSC